jgi:hypothetical protein
MILVLLQSLQHTAAVTEMKYAPVLAPAATRLELHS